MTVKIVNIPLQPLVVLQELDDEIAGLKECAKLIPGQIERSEKELQEKISRLKGTTP